MPNVVVFDVGGTKIASTVINHEGHDLLDGIPRRTTTQERGSSDEFIETMVGEFKALNEQFGDVVAWGAAFPGPYKRLPNGELQVLPRNIPAIRNHSVEEHLRKHIPNVPGIIDNDLKLALWGEHLIGALRLHQNAVGFVHSTGVSSAILLNGEVHRGPNNNAGELGCIIAERDPNKARPCDAQDGNAYGHLEAQIRGPVLAEIFFNVDRHDKQAVRNALENASNKQKQQIIDYCVPYVADAIAPILQAISTGNVLLFGGIATWLGAPYTRALSKELANSSEVFREVSKEESTPVMLPMHPHLSPLIGAAHQAFKKQNIDMTLNPPPNTTLH